jgi:hypothetical protein
MESKTWTHDDMQSAMRARGSHWWDPDTMRFFGTRMVGPVFNGPAGVFFATSEKPPHGPRGYTVRQFAPDTCDIGTVGEVCGYKSRTTAINAARRASGGGDYGNADFHPVGKFEQFLHDIHQHGGHCSMGQARDLIRLAKRHQRAMTDYCNGTFDAYDAEGEPAPRLARLCKRLDTLADSMGCGIAYQGDPRGCTVKLTFPDGFTNDWGREGYCVPMDN